MCIKIQCEKTQQNSTKKINEEKNVARKLTPNRLLQKSLSDWSLKCTNFKFAVQSVVEEHEQLQQQQRQSSSSYHRIHLQIVSFGRSLYVARSRSESVNMRELAARCSQLTHVWRDYVKMSVVRYGHYLTTTSPFHYTMTTMTTTSHIEHILRKITVGLR